MKNELKKTITLKGEEIEKLYSYSYDSIDGKIPVGKWKGWEVETDHESGTFDTEKGAMYNYKVMLINNDTKQVYVGYGGYYTAITGEVFNHAIEFTLKVPKRKKTKAEKEKEEYKLYLKLKKKYGRQR